MYALVADVERYPEFLPMCTGLVVNSRTPAPDALKSGGTKSSGTKSSGTSSGGTSSGGEELTARMSVGYKTISESFMTRVLLKPADLSITAHYLEGPFKRLENRWRFIDQPGGGSLVDFYISYEFKSAMLGILVGGVFDQAFRKFAEAFEDRARVVYGAPAAAM